MLENVTPHPIPIIFEWRDSFGLFPISPGRWIFFWSSQPIVGASDYSIPFESLKSHIFNHSIHDYPIFNHIKKKLGSSIFQLSSHDSSIFFQSLSNRGEALVQKNHPILPIDAISRDQRTFTEPFVLGIDGGKFVMDLTPDTHPYNWAGSLTMKL